MLKKDWKTVDRFTEIGYSLKYQTAIMCRMNKKLNQPNKNMKTQNQDRATAKTYNAGELMLMSHDDKIEIIQRLQSLQSEHAALVAVAVAAKDLAEQVEHLRKIRSSTAQSINIISAALVATDSALANLAAVQNK